MLKSIVAGVMYKDALDRIAAAMERCANALEQHLPPIQPEEPRKLGEQDYHPASDISTVEQQIFQQIEAAEGQMDAEKEARVREFIRSQYNL